MSELARFLKTSPCPDSRGATVGAGVEAEEIGSIISKIFQFEDKGKFK